MLSTFQDLNYAQHTNEQRISRYEYKVRLQSETRKLNGKYLFALMWVCISSIVLGFFILKVRVSNNLAFSNNLHTTVTVIS